MECGVACLAMICRHFGKNVSITALAEQCHATTEGVSLLGLKEVAENLGFNVICGRLSLSDLSTSSFPCVLHWKQKHFVVLYNVIKERAFYIADPAKGLVKYGREEFESNWISTQSNNEGKGIVMFLSPTSEFYTQTIEGIKDTRSFKFLFGYINKYKRYFIQIILGLLVGSLLQLVLPFLTQAIVDVGIKYQDIGFVWLILLGQFMLTVSRTCVDFIRRWLLLHISIRVNMSLIRDFFVKLLKLPMAFFETKLMGDLLQRIGDHSRVNSFLTQQTLNILFSVLTFIVFSIVLLSYSRTIFIVFLLGCLLYGIWLTLFLNQRKTLDYEMFERQSVNNDKTYEFLSSMQEIKLQDCEQRRLSEWEDTQVSLFSVY